MQLYSFGSVLVILFWLIGSGEYLSRQHKNSQQFTIYKRCIENHSVSTWKLLGPNYNASFYTNLNFRFNALIEKAFPIAIITPTESRDVEVAVKCGVKTGIQLVPISGGHSYAGLSYGSNDSIVIDFQYMNAVSVNIRERTVTVEPGTLMSQLYGRLWEEGKLGAAFGVCATVAMGGFVLSGGVGYFSAVYGLAIDNVLEINMVDARGNTVVVDSKHNEDLWWALRGIGPGYIGLVTSFKMKVFRADDLRLVLVQMRYHNRSFKSVMGRYIKWLDWAKENDPTISSVIIVTKDKGESPGMELQLLQVKDARIRGTGNLAFLNASRHIFPKPVSFDVTFPTFVEFVLANNQTKNDATKWISQTAKSRFDFLSSITKDKATPYYFDSKSFYVTKQYHEDDLIRAEKVLQEIPNDSSGFWVDSEQGAITEHRSNESSYVHRNALFNLKIFHKSYDSDHVEPNQKWIKKLYDSLKFLDSGETYQGFPERGLKDHLHRYYGSNLDRLIEIKEKWDPDGYFNSEQSIPIRRSPFWRS